MKLSPAMQDFILHWGDMGAKWGTNRSVAQIHALLHLSPNPLTADEICEALALARSNVSTGLKELQAYGVVKTSRQLGERKDRFHSIRDMMDLVHAVVASRREKEFLPTLEALQQVGKDARTDETPAEIRARMAETLETMEMFDTWYRDVSRLPKKVQLKLIRMGAKLARLIPGLSI